VGPQLTLKKPYKHCVCKAFLFLAAKTTEDTRDQAQKLGISQKDWII
jgi:hypothetical protein